MTRFFERLGLAIGYLVWRLRHRGLARSIAQRRGVHRIRQAALYQRERNIAYTEARLRAAFEAHLIACRNWPQPPHMGARPR